MFEWSQHLIFIIALKIMHRLAIISKFAAGDELCGLLFNSLSRFPSITKSYIFFVKGPKKWSSALLKLSRLPKLCPSLEALTKFSY
jgi:hypothetical protein